MARRIKRFARILSQSVHFKKVVLPLHLLFLISLFILLKTGDYLFLCLIPFFWVLFSGIGLAVGYHRLLAHRAFNASRVMRRFATLMGIYAGQGSPIAWVSIHRGLHHPFADQSADPHTPNKGWWNAYFGWQVEVGAQSVNPRHALDLLRDPFMKTVSVHYHLFYWLGPAAVAALDWRLALFAVIPAMVIANHQENCINTFCHQRALGYRNFDIADDSVNIWILGLLCWGQGYHNNHHRLPRAANFGVQAWEFDPSRPLVWLLASREPSAQGQEAAAIGRALQE